MRSTFAGAVVFSLCLAAFVVLSQAEDKKPPEDPLAQDMELLQGKWEMYHGNEGKGEPTIHSVKEIKGNRETLRRYDAKTGKLNREHTVEFTLSTSGAVRVFTFYPVDGDPKSGASFVYKVDAHSFYDIPGILTGDTYRNYQPSPAIWHWKRVKEEPKEEAAEETKKEAK